MGINASSHPSPMVNTLVVVCCVVHFHLPPCPLRRHVTGHNKSTRAVCYFHKVCETKRMPSAVHATTSLMDDISVFLSGNMTEVSRLLLLPFLSDSVLRPFPSSQYNLHDVKPKEDI